MWGNEDDPGYQRHKEYLEGEARLREQDPSRGTRGGFSNNPLPRGCIFYAIVIVLLAFGVEFAAVALQQLVLKVLSTVHATPPAALLSWILFTGHIFSGLATLALLGNWVSGLFGRGCLGGLVKTIAILFFLLFLSGLVTALLVAWLNATGKIV